MSIRRSLVAAALALAISPAVAVTTAGAASPSTSGGYATITGGCFRYQTGGTGGSAILMNFYHFAQTANIHWTLTIRGLTGVPPSDTNGAVATPTILGYIVTAGTYMVSLTWTIIEGGPGHDTTVGAHGNTGWVTLTVPNCTGSVANGSPYSVAIASTPTGRGFWVVNRYGRVKTYENAPFFGDAAQVDPGEPASPSNSFTPSQPIVGMAPSYDSSGNVNGYWLDAADGGIFAFGTAPFYGSMGGQPLNQPMVGMATTPDGHGYWLVAADGGLFAFGDAQFYGSMGGKPLNKPVVGMASDLATGGYWLVASDGGVFSFNAPFEGSTGAIQLNRPIVQMAAATDGSGYRFVASDGGVFCFNEPFAGSWGGASITNVVGMAPYGTQGYWLLRGTGSIASFGGAPIG
ncbi:MAG TPA: hypothetical protein VHB02_05455 [Acidimicrobiales bacterium]|nr:hypothetical protein [Acidimicrobiales bacterium]